MRQPPFCPNSHCPHYYRDECSSDDSRWYHSDGSFFTARVGEVARYRCCECGKRFSESTFSLDYYAKRKINLRRLRRSLASASSLRGASRQLFCSPETVTRRIMILARQSIAAHAELSQYHSRREPLAADGFQSFSVSQYHPNHFNLLCGDESQYVYAMTSVSLKRSGRMSAAQRAKRDQIEAADPSDPGALEREFCEIVTAALRLWQRQEEQAGDDTEHNEEAEAARREFITDEHPIYPWAIISAGATGKMEHRTVNSRAPRSGDNPLFSVNYTDREIRKDLAEHHRETVCFARGVSHSVARMWVYLVWHNIEKPYRISPRSQATHAEVSGVSKREVRRQRRKVFRRRAFLGHYPQLSESQRRDWLQLHWTPERENRINRRITPAYATN